VKKAILAARLAGRTSCRHLSSAPLDFLPSTFEVAIKAKMDRSRNGHCRKTLKFRGMSKYLQTASLYGGKTKSDRIFRAFLQDG
jgi:hypothetical protein